MSPIRVSHDNVTCWALGWISVSIDRSIYQDIPLYSEDEFLEKAPEASRSVEVLSDEHALMLARLNFELAERQRYGNLTLL